MCVDKFQLVRVYVLCVCVCGSHVLSIGVSPIRFNGDNAIVIIGGFIEFLQMSAMAFVLDAVVWWEDDPVTSTALPSLVGFVEEPVAWLVLYLALYRLH